MTNVPETNVLPANVPDTLANNTVPAQQVELRPELHNWCEAWKTSLQNVVSQVSGTASGRLAVFEIASRPLPTADSDVWYTVVAGGAVHGEAGQNQTSSVDARGLCSLTVSTKGGVPMTVANCCSEPSCSKALTTT